MDDQAPVGTGREIAAFFERATIGRRDGYPVPVVERVIEGADKSHPPNLSRKGLVAHFIG